MVCHRGLSFMVTGNSRPSDKKGDAKRFMGMADMLTRSRAHASFTSLMVASSRCARNLMPAISSGLILHWLTFSLLLYSLMMSERMLLRDLVE